MPCRARRWPNCRPARQQLQSLSAELKQGQPQLATRQAEKRRPGGRSARPAPAADRHRRAHRTAGAAEDRPTTPRSRSCRPKTARFSAGFANDRVAVTRLLAVLERLQHDMPPALAMRPDDALGAARGAMLIGASLPPVYAQAASPVAADRCPASAPARRWNSSRPQAPINRRPIWPGRVCELDGLLAQQGTGSRERRAGSYAELKTQLEAVARQGGRFPGAADPGQGAAPARRTDGTDSSVVTVTRRKCRFPGRPGQGLPAGTGGGNRAPAGRQRQCRAVLCHPARCAGDRARRWQGSFCRPLP